MGVYTTTTAIQILMVGTELDSATSALCSKMITHAENEVNKYLSKRFDVSSFQTSVPPLVESLTETLTEGYMYQRMSRGGKESTARAKMLIDQALENLKAISEYKLDLVDSSGDIIADSSETAYRASSTTENYANTFNEDDQLNWQVDPQKLSDISEDRDS